MANSEVSRLKFNDTTYEIADELARESIGTALTEVASVDAKAEAYNTALSGRITNLENSSGAVLVAKTRTAMTDTSKIYVYTGTATTASGVTYTPGHWYYHNGSKWTDGGAYTQNLDAIDATLTQSNKGADAKVTGDRLTAAETDISTLRGTIANEYASQTYSVGDYCYHNGLLYRCNTEISVAETWTSSHWTAVDVMPEISNLKNDWKNTTDYETVAYKNLVNIDYPPSESASGEITSGGVWQENSTKTIDKFYVAPGNLIYIETGVGIWQFQNNRHIPYRNNTYIVGTTHPNGEYGYFVVPDGATYCLITRDNEDTTGYLKTPSRISKSNPKILSAQDFRIGSYTKSQGKVIFNRSALRITSSEFLTIGANEVLNISCPPEYSVAIGIAEVNLDFIEELGWKQNYSVSYNSSFVAVPVIRKGDGTATIQPSEITSDFTIEIIKKSKIKETPTNIVGKIFNDGMYMDTDGIVKMRSQGSNWCYTDYIPIVQGVNYNIFSFVRKNKICGNVYVNYFDENKVWISCGHITNSHPDYTIPSNCHYLVFSGEELEITYLYVTTGIPKLFIHGENTNYPLPNNHNIFGKNIISYAKNGINTFGKNGYPIYPHGSKWAFISAVNEGFDALLIDVIPTSDGHLVVSHQDNLYPYAKNMDGTSLSNPYNIREHTLQELQSIDMGYDYGVMFRGSVILTLEELLFTIKELNVPFIIEPEYTLTQEKFREMVETVAQYGFEQNAIFFSYYKSELEVVKSIIPKATLFLYAGSSSSVIDGHITDAISLKTDINTVYINAFAQLANEQYPNLLTQTQIQRMIDNHIMYSVSTPSNEPDGFLNFMKNAPLANYATLFGSELIPAQKMLLSFDLQ